MIFRFKKIIIIKQKKSIFYNKEILKTKILKMKLSMKRMFRSEKYIINIDIYRVLELVLGINSMKFQIIIKIFHILRIIN